MQIMLNKIMNKMKNKHFFCKKMIRVFKILLCTSNKNSKNLLVIKNLFKKINNNLLN